METSSQCSLLAEIAGKIHHDDTMVVFGSIDKMIQGVIGTAIINTNKFEFIIAQTEKNRIDRREKRHDRCCFIIDWHYYRYCRHLLLLTGREAQKHYTNPQPPEIT